MVSEKKVGMFKKINKLLKEHDTLLLFDLNQVPSRQLHQIRNKLKKEEIFTIVPKKSVLELSLKENKKDLKLDDFKQPALIYSNKNIFDILKILKKLTAKRKIKVNEIVSNKVEIPAMDTEIQAGPAISIFKQFQIQTIIKAGKIAIREPKIVCKEGDKADENLVSLLNMLGIQPAELTIQPTLGCSQNLVFNKSILELDETYFKDQINICANNLFKLTTYVGYPTKDNISVLLQKGGQHARSLGMELGIPTKELLPDLLRIAHANASNLDASSK